MRVSKYGVISTTNDGGILIDLFQAGEKACFIADLGCAVVIGMAAFPVGQDDGSRPEFTNTLCERHATGHGIFQTRVGEMQILAMGNF
jgi:hypothetical protein